ncbi:MAG TPA: Nramp family divalent metal transporter [Woeseiaceae bacterium]|jgi:Mn2+/Fe2+ NRAMP family transporter|nr:Nramp family divalent metal transporter [Woeseiaceae bacterium]
MNKGKTSVLAILGPGLLVAATGIGAGDLATASFTGSILGTAVLWAAVVGAFLKFVMTEGLARYQLATGDTLLEGLVRRLGRPLGWLFLPYLVIWSFFVASALMSACGVTLHAMIPLFDDAAEGKIAFGILSSLVGMALVFIGGYDLFEKVMRVCIGVMFVTVIVTAALLWPGTGAVLQGLLIPTIPDLPGQGLSWTVALMGGIGGTFTVLCYGYWIREEGRAGSAFLRTCRIDLAVGYAATALFGVAMVIIGSTIEIEGRGASLLIRLSQQLVGPLGETGKWLFLVGAFGAVFSSLLGVWQAVPYLFADTWGLLRESGDAPAHGGDAAPVDTSSLAYRGYLVALAIVPMAGLLWSFKEIQKIYAVIGATFIPVLAIALLLLNGRSAWVGERYRNRPATVVVLLATLAFFLWMGWRTLA